MSVTPYDLALPDSAAPKQRSLARGAVHSVAVLLSSLPVQLLLWCYLFYAYHTYAIEHGLQQTQLWYYETDALPLYARAEGDWQANWQNWRYALPPIAIFLVWLPLVVARLLLVRIPTPAWLLACFTFVLCMNVAVAEIDGGWPAITKPFTRTNMEYIGDVPDVADKPLEFIRNYPQLIRDRVVCHHAGTHPPGGVVFLWLAGHLWGHALFQACAATIVTGALTVIPAYLLVRRIYGPTAATVASALYVVTPNLVLFGGTTCMDGVFALFPVTAAWLFFEAVTPRPPARNASSPHATRARDVQSTGGPLPPPLPSPSEYSWTEAPAQHVPNPHGASEAPPATDIPASNDPQPHPLPPLRLSLLLATLTGLALAAGFFFTFATVCIGIVTATYNLFAIARGPRHFLRVLLVNTVAAVTLVAVYAVTYWTGTFDLIDCVRAAIDENARIMGTGREDLATWLDVSFANLFAFLIGTGAAATALWGRRFARAAWDTLRGRGVDLLPLSFTVAIVAIAFAPMFHFEVERIWIFLTPLVLAVAARNLLTDAGRVRWVAFTLAAVFLFAQTYLTELWLFTWW